MGKGGALGEGAEGDHLRLLVPVVADGVGGPLPGPSPGHNSRRYHAVQWALIKWIEDT